jgi:phosphoribosyl-dephospho-CoA transferase
LFDRRKVTDIDTMQISSEIISKKMYSKKDRHGGTCLQCQHLEDCGERKQEFKAVFSYRETQD